MNPQADRGTAPRPATLPGGRRLIVQRTESTDDDYQVYSPKLKSAPKPSGSGGASSTGSKDQFKLNEEQKAMLKRVNKEGKPIKYDQRNPKREGSMSFKRYEAYKAATTVAEFLSLGGVTADLAFDYSHGYLSFPSEGALASFVPMVEISDSGKDSASTGSNSKRTASEGDEYKVPHKKASAESAFDTSRDRSRRPKEEEDAFAVSQADILQAEAEESEDEPDELGSVAALDAAVALYDAGQYSDALSAVNEVLSMGQQGDDNAVGKRSTARAKRLRGLAVMKMGAAGKMKSNLRQAQGASEEKATKGCSFGQEILPTRHDHEESQLRERRDLAKETRGDLAERHEPKGVRTLFETRLKQSLNACLDAELKRSSSHQTPSDAPSNCEASIVPVKYRFGADEETFELHCSGMVPAHASMPSAPSHAQAAPSTSLDAIVALLQASQASSLQANDLSSEGSKPTTSFVDLYGRWGVTALSLAAFAQRQDTVAALLALGADAGKALDGALYLSQTKDDLRWVLNLVQALETAEVPNLEKVVQHARLTGETALLVAVGQNNLEAVKVLLAMGARVAQEGQKDKDGRTCLELAASVAKHKASSALLEFLQSHPTATQ